MSDAERRERLTQLVLCRAKLSPEEAALLREVFPEIVAMHHDQVWNLLRRRGLDSHDAEDLLQEVFRELYEKKTPEGMVARRKFMVSSTTWPSAMTRRACGCWLLKARICCTSIVARMQALRISSTLRRAG